MWNHTDKVPDFYDGDQLFFEVFDHDKVGKDTRLGYASVGWEELQDDSAVLKETLVLEESGKQDKEPATVDVKITVLKRKLEINAGGGGTGSTSLSNIDKCYRLYVDLRSVQTSVWTRRSNSQ
eukprot:Skav207110  [mRNA]  locus=scaffold156:163151:166581:- [translate_table: standard]